jgi:tripartite-type tricarboxylate transporter receptor subunit TctC
MRLAPLLVAGLFVSAGALAQSYPTKPVRVVIPVTPGSGLDLVGRYVSRKLSEIWGQPVVIDNRPGAGGVVGTAVVAKAPADGYTLLVVGNSHAVNPALYANLPYDTLKDFTAIAPLARLDLALVVAPSAGIRSVAELVAAAKARPGEITYASPGVGSGNHFAGEKFKLATGIDVLHVPYKGGPEAMTDVMMGRVTFWLPSVGTALPLVREGKLIALGVANRERSAFLPDVPTIAEAGVAGFEDSLLFGMWAPAGTPAGVVNKVAKDIARALAAQDLREQLKTLSAEPTSMTSTDFTRHVRGETETVARIAKAAGIKAQ